MWWNYRSFCNKADKSRHFFPVFPPHRKFALQKAKISVIISICGSVQSRKNERSLSEVMIDGSKKERSQA